jgi:phosphoribosyl 1,2-cyclic phosphodiesterase
MSSQSTTLSFWGVRGSTPTVDRANMRYGGNTPCLELTTRGGTRFILDCGTGLRMLSNSYTAQANGNGLGAHVFVTHYHWDHIQGLPFFNPLYSPQNQFYFYSFRSDFLGRDSLKRVLEAQMAVPYFPVDLSAMSAQREFTELAGGDKVIIGDSTVTACWLNHPQGCLGFRFDTPDGSIVYATDNEPGRREFDATLLELCTGANVLINDAQFKPEQLPARKGWGHSSWQESICLAKKAGVQNLILFHHDPDSTDKDLDENLRLAQKQFESVYMAAEGMVLKLEEGRMDMSVRIVRDLVRHGTFCPAVIAGSTPDGREFVEDAVIQDLSIQGAFVQLESAPQLQSAVEVTIQNFGANGAVPLVLRGRVVRLDRASSSKKTGVGILFSE